MGLNTKVNAIKNVPTNSTVLKRLGDSFTGSFVAALLNGKRMSEVHQLAVEVSAYVCTQHGAMPTLPTELIEKAKG